MDDLISRAAVLEELADLYWTEERFLTFKDVDGVFDRIKALPSAQPEIIRCKDCKKYDMHDHRCKHWNHGVVVMDWCSKAERR